MLRILKITVITLFFTPLCCYGLIDKLKNAYYGSHSEKNIPKKQHVIYSHGFGEPASAGEFYTQLYDNPDYIAPQYENEVQQAPFYTQESQKKLLKSLVEAEKAGTKGLFVGRSMGGGTGINLLDKLINYEKNKDFFADTDIKSAEDAQKVLNTINKSKVIFTAPALSMRETTAIRMPSSILSAATFAGFTAGVFYLWSSYKKKKEAEQKIDETIKEKKESEEQLANESIASEESTKTNRIKEFLAKIGIIGLGGAAWYIFGDALTNVYASGVVKWGLPWATGGHFNPADTEPGEALKRIISSPKYTAQTLWHFNKNDEILYHPEEKIKQLFENKNPSHEVIFTNDASHNVISRQYIEKVNEFHKK